jgi:hypothetical protein
VSELAPGVNGMTMLIGRDDSSSAVASVIAIGLAVRNAARMTDALDISTFRCCRDHRTAFNRPPRRSYTIPPG